MARQQQLHGVADVLVHNFSVGRQIKNIFRDYHASGVDQITRSVTVIARCPVTATVLGRLEAQNHQIFYSSYAPWGRVVDAKRSRDGTNSIGGRR